MKLNISLIGIAVLLSSILSSTSASKNESGFNPSQADENKLVYADFEKVENGRAVSNGGGLIQIYVAQQSTPVTFKGLPNASPGAPELVRLKDSETNHLAAFNYSLTGPNQWANVTLEIQGRPTSNGQPAADDVSTYKNLSMQLYATGIESVRVEAITKGQGITVDAGPQMAIRLKPGLNTYLVPLKSLAQPSWTQDRVDTKEVLRKLTAISISAFCNECTPRNGQIIVDNLVFQK